MNRKSFIVTIATALLLAATGCKTVFNTENIEAKSRAIMFTVASMVIQNNAGSDETRSRFAMASADLKFLAAQENLDVLTVLAIVQSLPQIQDDPTVRIVVTGAIMFFSDGLTSFGVKNPAEVKLAAKGCAAGIDEALGITVPPAVTNPAPKYQSQRRALRAAR